MGRLQEGSESSLYGGCRSAHVPAHKFLLFSYCCTLPALVCWLQYFPKLNYNSVLPNGLSQVAKKVSVDVGVLSQYWAF